MIISASGYGAVPLFFADPGKRVYECVREPDNEKSRLGLGLR